MTKLNQKMEFSNFFEALVNDQPYLKMAIQGFAGSGKTFLATQIAIGLHQEIKSTKPIILYDTEKSFRALKDMFDEAGIQALTRKSRTLTDLEKAFDAVEAGFADILIIDSITHVWESFVQGYMEAKSNRLKKRVTRLTFQDWGYIKPEWKRRFSDRIVNGNLHVIFTGRAGYEYSHEQDEESGKMTELIKSGIRMKAETETAYEPDVLVNMETVEDLLHSQKTIYRLATVIKDRYRLVDGLSFKNPTYKDFQPMIQKALSGQAKKGPDAETPDDFSELEPASENWAKRRDVALEEIKALLQQMGLGTSQADKTFMVDWMEKAFGSRSWTKVESLPVETLEAAIISLEQLKNEWLAYCKDNTGDGKKIDLAMRYEFLGRDYDTII